MTKKNNVENINNFKQGVEDDTSEEAPQPPEAQTGGPSDIETSENGRNDRDVSSAENLIREAMKYSAEIVGINEKTTRDREVPKTRINELKKRAAKEYGVEPKAFARRLAELEDEVKKVKKRDSLNEEERADFDALTLHGNQQEMEV